MHGRNSILSGELALEPFTAYFDLEDVAQSLPMVLYRTKNGKATTRDLLYLTTPGLIDTIVYHDRLVMERADGTFPEACEAITSLEKAGIIRFVPQGTLFDIKNKEFQRFRRRIELRTLKDPRYYCIEILARPEDYLRYMKRNNLLRDIPQAVIDRLKKQPFFHDNYASLISLNEFLGNIDIGNLYCSLLKNEPQLEVLSTTHMQYAFSFASMHPTLAVEPNFLDCSDVQYAVMALICNDIVDERLGDGMNYVLRKLNRVRTDLTQNLRLEAEYLFKIERDDVEMPLTLALILDRIKETKVTPALLWEALLKLRSDSSTVKFRKFLKKFDAAVKDQDREAILRAKCDVDCVAKDLIREYSSKKNFETKHLAVTPSMAKAIILQQYDKILEVISQELIENAPFIADRLDLKSHITYMTALGKTGIKTDSLKKIFLKRMGDVGKKMAQKYIFLSQQMDVAQRLRKIVHIQQAQS
jgi:hypothetical protein